jgi:hypothetical protein
MELEINAFSICKGLLARLDPRGNSPKKTILVMNWYSIMQNKSVLTKTNVKLKIQPSILSKFVWHILLCHCLMETMIPLSLNLNQVGKKAKQVTCQLKKGDAYTVCCKTHVNNSKKCSHNSVNCTLHCSSEGNDGAHSTENNQQFSHEDVEASEARLNAEYDRGTEGEEGDDSGDGKDGGAEGGKGDDTAEQNHGEDDDSWEESSDQDD